MKRIIIISISIILLLIGLVVASPFIFKGKIEKIALRKINENVDAVVSYKRFSLSFIRTFPNAHATFSDFLITGKNEFENDTLIFMGSLSASINIKSLFSDNGIQVNKIKVDNSLISMKVNANKEVNWNIIASDENVESTNQQNETSEIVEDSEALVFALDQIEINSMTFKYDDVPAQMYFESYETNARLSGEMQGMQTDLEVEAHSPAVTFMFDSVNYLNRNKIGLTTMLDANFDEWAFIFKSEKTQVNDIPVSVSGGFSMPTDSMVFDIDFNVPQLTFAQLIALIPENYQDYTKDANATGNINFNGYIKGSMTDDQYPAIEVDMELKNGIISYPDLPEKITVNLAHIQVQLPQGPIEALKVNLSALEGSIAGNPFSLFILADQLFSDPLIDAGLNGTIDLAQLPKAIPVQIDGLQGIVQANVKISGRMSDLEQNRFDRFTSMGFINIDKLQLVHEKLPGKLSVSKANLTLNNENVSINGFSGQIGNSDFTLSGNLHNPVKYFLLNEELTGRFELNSKYFDLNQFKTKKENTTVVAENAESQPDSEKSPTTEQKPLELPKNTNLTFVSRIDHLQFDKLDIRRFNGTITLKQQLLTLEGLKMELLKGTLNLQGSILADGRANPDADLKIILKDFDLPSSFQQIAVVQNYIPMAKNSQGKFSTTLSLKSKISNNWKMIVEGINASGSFATQNVKVEKNKAVDQLQSLIKTEKIKDINVKDFSTRFSIKDGNLVLDPFDTELADQPVKVAGSYNLAGTIDLRIDATLQRDLLSDNIEQMIAYIPGHQKVNKINIGIDLKGDAKKPEVIFDRKLITQQVLNQVKNSSPKEIEDAARKIFNQLFK